MWALWACVVTVGWARHVLTFLSVSISCGDSSFWSLHRHCCEFRGNNVWPVLGFFWVYFLSHHHTIPEVGSRLVSLWCRSNWSINPVLYRTKRVVTTFPVLKLHVLVINLKEIHWSHSEGPALKITSCVISKLPVSKGTLVSRVWYEIMGSFKWVYLSCGPQHQKGYGDFFHFEACGYFETCISCEFEGSTLVSQWCPTFEESSSVIAELPLSQGYVLVSAWCEIVERFIWNYLSCVP